MKVSVSTVLRKKATSTHKYISGSESGSENKLAALNPTKYIYASTTPRRYKAIVPHFKPFTLYFMIFKIL
jgi:hypothetical protein